MVGSKSKQLKIGSNTSSPPSLCSLIPTINRKDYPPLAKDYDWTYSTNYAGNYQGGQWCEEGVKRVNYAKLSSLDEKILFFHETVLFEDELADNGISQFSVKIVIPLPLPTCVCVCSKLNHRI